MSDLPESTSHETEDDATRAFDALRVEVLTVHVAVAELTKAVKDTRPVDYTISLGKIGKTLAQVVGRLEIIEQHPALLLTPEQHQQAIANGARVIMREPLASLKEERRASADLNKDLVALVGSVRRQRQQLKWVLVTAAAALLIGLFLSPFLAHLLPFGPSGPRCGLGELLLPANEPGSSIMPGKVNPTQQEAMVMVCIQAIAEDYAVAIAGSQGNFELNAMRPIVINNFLHCARILGDACEKLRRFSVEGTQLNRKRIDELVGRSLMLVTALSPVIGYDKASAIAHLANDHELTLREAAIASGVITARSFEEIVDPRKLIGNGVAGS